MSAFFEHLRENLGIQEETNSEPDASPPPKHKRTVRRPPKVSAKKPAAPPSPVPLFESWEKEMGELGVDVYETESEFVIQSPVAGVTLEGIRVSVEDDMAIIVGHRTNPDPSQKTYRIQECYWGGFSRRVLLPDDVDAEHPRVSMKDGILTIRFSKKPTQETTRVIIET
ncbi:MAG: Hsp20/alpha crystallin family protein [Candidatus Wildermuthbacteria bacterium]|nr:Hsp20/alpha crystallin family protein [Candidatus Wildermuthbacteria bacterium]